MNAGWGAAGGYLGLIPRDDGPWVAVQVFESESLADAWQELDAFEGSEYRRVLIPVYSEDTDAQLLYIANLYALARGIGELGVSQGTSKTFPTVRLDSSAACAAHASPNGSVRSMCTRNHPASIQLNNSDARAVSSCGVAV